MRMVAVAAALLFGLPPSLSAQVFNPKVLLEGQIDASDPAVLAEGICRRAGAVTPRQKAEAIWRFFLTDGRFVEPGFWYHIAGWAYEEPGGEVLDATKLLNSYGFGLCYHIAPLLEAVYEAAGFEDARVWFLTGHTVTEVFYDGAYHHYDSDMLGYTTVGAGDPRKLPVASVLQISRDGNIILGKLKSQTEADKSKVDYPWYPADVQARAMNDLAALFTSAGDNWLYPHTRYAKGHTMDFVLRPGERMIRYYEPEATGVFYLPYRFDGRRWQEFPQEVAQYGIRTEDGPRSQKDGRRWATGVLEYRPVLSSAAAYYPQHGGEYNANLHLPDPKSGREYLSLGSDGVAARATFDMQSPYILIDAEVSLEITLADERAGIDAALSVDGGKNWESMGRIKGPVSSKWQVRPEARLRSQHGVLTAVSGIYGYLVRLTLTGGSSPDSVRVTDVELRSRFQHNPRTLPALAAGSNVLKYTAGRQIGRRPLPVSLDKLDRFANSVANAKVVDEGGQMIMWPSSGSPASVLFELSADKGTELAGFDAGARFLDLRDGLAPDKFTAETRKSGLALKPAGNPGASLAWSMSPSGPFQDLWAYDSRPTLKDGEAVRQALRWPEVDKRIIGLPAGTTRVFVRYSLRDMGLDSLRMAAYSSVSSRSEALEITHVWFEGPEKKDRVIRVLKPWQDQSYMIETGTAGKLTNHALILSCPRTVVKTADERP